MSFRLENVVPWGRSYGEYVSMFSLDEADLRKRMLGCGDGPASFNAELTRRGGHMVSVDPLYRFTSAEIRLRIDETREEVLEQARKNQHEFNWTTIRSVEHLGQLRMAAMEDFLSDYASGLNQGRYVAGELPQLPFRDGEFDLALCSHFLFLYSEQLSKQFHVAAIREICRVAREVRIFPVLEFGAQTSRHLDAVTEALKSDGYGVRLEAVDYEFQKGGNRMMVVKVGE